MPLISMESKEAGGWKGEYHSTIHQEVWGQKKQFGVLNIDGLSEKSDVVTFLMTVSIYYNFFLSSTSPAHFSHLFFEVVEL